MNYNSAVVTGSSGFIGRHLIDALKNEKINILEVSRSTNSIDITKWEQVEKIPGQDMVFHLAGITNIQKAFSNPRDVYFSNCVGTLNILEWCRNNHINKMIYISSFVYGSPLYLPIDEKHPVAPNNPYSQSKLIGEDLCKAYSRDYGFNVIILRLFNIYGPHHKGNFLIPQILSQLPKGEVKLGNPVPKRDFIYINDAVNAILAASIADIHGCDIFNIASGMSYSAEEVANILIGIYFKETGKKISITYTKYNRKGEIADTIANIEKAKKILKWKPMIDIETGLSMTLRAYLHEYKE